MNQTEQTRLAVIANDVGYIKEELKEIKTQVSSHYVSKEEFEPIKKIVYGLVALILIGVVGGVLSLVVVK